MWDIFGMFDIRLYHFVCEFSFLCSFDGVPFLFHDNTLVRTTDFEDIRNSNISEVPMRNTMSELKMLNAGSWFLRVSLFS